MECRVRDGTQPPCGRDSPAPMCVGIEQCNRGNAQIHFISHLTLSFNLDGKLV